MVMSRSFDGDSSPLLQAPYTRAGERLFRSHVSTDMSVPRSSLSSARACSGVREEADMGEPCGEEGRGTFRCITNLSRVGEVSAFLMYDTLGPVSTTPLWLALLSLAAGCDGAGGGSVPPPLSALGSSFSTPLWLAVATASARFCLSPSPTPELELGMGEGEANRRGPPPPTCPGPPSELFLILC